MESGSHDQYRLPGREDAGGLPEPDILARSIVEDLWAALAQFAAIAGDLGAEDVEEPE